MKIAVCYSGQYRPWDGWKENHQELFGKIGKPSVYYSTWQYEKSRIPKGMNMRYFDEPSINYNPYKVKQFVNLFGNHIGDKPDEKKRIETSTLQHLAHESVVNSIDKSKYDLIIRMRYDTIVDSSHDWMKLVRNSFFKQMTYGFGNTSRTHDENKVIHKVPPTLVNVPNRILDFMIIHPIESLTDVSFLSRLNTLMPTNAGWWQSFGQKNYENYFGGIQLKRYT